MVTHWQDTYSGKRVLVTGHTGFKGAWLCEWLLSLGARVSGLSLAQEDDRAIFHQLDLASRLDHHIADLRDLKAVSDLVATVKPDIVFHMAAQALVRESYTAPVDTYASNVMGTVHVLEALRQLDQPCACVCITTDKCYENREWLYGYRECDMLGGYDPYSSSKACAEIAAASYIRSFFSVESPVCVLTARAGNVIGGGDWAKDRIVPDCINALLAGKPIPVRNRYATRPWQHVLEPLGGYLMLGHALVSGCDLHGHTAFNFGPTLRSNRPVSELVETVLRFWPGSWEDFSPEHAPHEAGRLNLSIDLAYHELGWHPVMDFEETIEQTIAWYRRQAEAPGGEAMQAFTREQIARYAARMA